jgi:hypothetical protein
MKKLALCVLLLCAAFAGCSEDKKTGSASGGSAASSS